MGYHEEQRAESDGLADRSRYDMVFVSLYDEITSAAPHFLANYLRRRGFRCLVISLLAEAENVFSSASLEAAVRLVKQSGTRYVGLSVTTDLFASARELTAQVKRECSCRVIWGGVHPTLRYEQCLREGQADAACVGDGEVVMAACLAGRPPEQVEGLAWRDAAGRVHYDGTVAEIVPMDESAPQTMFHPDNLVVYPQGHNEQIGLAQTRQYGAFILGKPSYRIMASRDCPHGCTYCCNAALKACYEGKGKGARRQKDRSIDSLLNELSMVRREYPECEVIRFGDDTFMSRPTAWYEEFMPRYRAVCGLPFSCLASPETVRRPQVLARLVEAGMSELQIGVQSGSERIRCEMYSRPQQTTASVETMIDLLAPYASKVHLVFDMIFDNPLETEEDALASVGLIVKITVAFGRRFEVNPYSLTLFPGTALAERIGRERPEVAPSLYHKKCKGIAPTYLNTAIANSPLFPLDLDDVMRYVEQSERIGTEARQCFGQFVEQWGRRYRAAVAGTPPEAVPSHV